MDFLGAFTYFSLLGKIFLWLALVYFIGAVALLATVKAHKDEDGHAIIDHKAWYFTAAYPYRRNSGWFINEVTTNGLNICPFYARLFFSILLLWPFLIIIEIAKLIIGNILTLPFGFVCKPGLAKIREPEPADIFLPSDDNVIRLSYSSTPRWYVPTVVYVLYYATCWVLFPKPLGILTVVIVGVAIVIGLIVALDQLIKKMRKRKQENVGKTSLFGEWMRAKASRVCMKLKVV
jgi:hypothetical protein